MDKRENARFSILVVDDNKENLKVVSNFLKEKGYQIALSLNADDALKIIRENPIDLILLDIMMPGTDGYTLCKKLKADEKTREIPVIFLTAKTDTSDLVEGFRVGGVDYITKPFHKEELLARVKNQIDLSHAKKQIRNQADHILRINKTKDRLYSVIAHDIKSPFANISMLLSSVAEGYLEPGTEEYDEILQSLNTSTKETYSLLENLLRWTRAQTGDLDCVPENIHLAELAGNIIRYLSPNASKKNIALELLLEDDLHCYADNMMLQSIMQNLVSNAIKFTPEGGSIVVSGARKYDQARIAVKDTGVGIPEENLKKLFSSDGHFTTVGTNNEKGSGLGLLLVSDFVKRNKGSLKVESQVGRGTTFTIFLPLK
jgi:two-component system, sensor histidine kinase and response regulator